MPSDEMIASNASVSSGNPLKLTTSCSNIDNNVKKARHEIGEKYFILVKKSPAKTGWTSRLLIFPVGIASYAKILL